MKRLLSIFLCFAICLTLMPGMSVSAEPGTMEGDGSVENPYQITTAEQLLEFREIVNGGDTDACAKLMNDIVFNEGVTFEYRPDEDNKVWIDGKPLTEENTPKDRWEPISVPNIPVYELIANPNMELNDGWYNGVFDGQGHTISGLYCDYPQEMTLVGMTAAALFASLGPDGVVRNVGIENSFFRADAAASVVVGSQGTVHGCYSDAIVVGIPQEVGSTDAYAGGICCFTVREQAAIERCFYTGSIYGVTVSEEGKGDSHQFGGILGSIGLLNQMGGAEDFADNYYIEGNGVTIAGCEPMSEEAFAEGRVADLLNSSSAVNDTSMMFLQNLDMEPREAYPGYGVDSHQVYRINGCQDGIVFYSNYEDRRDTHEYNEEGICVNGCNAHAAVAYTVGETSAFAATVEEAFAVRNESAVSIRLLSDCSAGVIDLTEYCTYTLDLNGKTLDVSAIYITGSSAILVIQDSVGGGSLKSSFDLAPITVKGGELYVEGGRIEYAGSKEGTPAVKMTAGRVEISGGSFVGKGKISVELVEPAQITGGKFQGLRCDIDISEFLTDGTRQYEAVSNGKLLDTDTTELEQEFQVMLAEDVETPEENTEPSEENTEPDEEPEETEDPDDAEETDDPTESTEGTEATDQEPTDEATEPTFDDSDLVKPDLPALETDQTPVVGIPAANGIPSVCKDDLYLVLDADPLLGLSRQELFSNLVVQQYEGYETVFEISEYDEKLDMVRTSDRLTISYREKGKVVQNRTFVIVILGDTNCDGMAMANDAALMTKLIQGTDVPELLLAADVNNDGAVKANDAQRLIYRYFNYSLDYETPMN